MKAAAERNPDVNRSFSTLVALSESKEERLAAENREKAWRDYHSMRDAALAEGGAHERMKNAKNFKSLGVDIDIISKATGLSKDEISRL